MMPGMAEVHPLSILPPEKLIAKEWDGIIRGLVVIRRKGSLRAKTLPDFFSTYIEISRQNRMSFKRVSRETPTQ